MQLTGYIPSTKQARAIAEGRRNTDGWLGQLSFLYSLGPPAQG